MFVHRPALALTLLLGPALVPGLAVWPGGPPPYRLTQLPGTPEPSLADQAPGPLPPPAPIPAFPAPPAPIVPVPPILPAPPPVPPSEPPVPVVALRVRVPACAPEAHEIKYLICADNTSPAPAHHVLVRVSLPANTRLLRAEPPPASQEAELLWAFGTLPGLTCKEIWLVLQPLGTDDVKLCARVQFEHGQCVCTRIARAGPPGAPGVPVVPYTGQPPGKAPAEKVPAKGAPRLDLNMTGPKQGLAGKPTTYTLTLANVGPSPASNAMITALLPAATSFVSASEGGRHVANQVAWLIGTLDAGAAQSR